MDTYFQAIIMSFREGLEAFLILSILLQFLDKIGKSSFKKDVWKGALTGVIASLVLGGMLLQLSNVIGSLKTTAKLWESIAALFAVILVTTFIIWMIKNGSKIKGILENEVAANLSKNGLFLLSFFMVVREGAEIAVFSFAGKYSLLPVLIGLSISIALVLLINYSLIKVNIKTLFIITLGYLILQAGYLLGYSIHEGISAIKSIGRLDSDHIVFGKAFNLSNTFLNHKTGTVGLPMNVILGWYSKPEWLQLLVHYGYVFALFFYWKRKII